MMPGERLAAADMVPVDECPLQRFKKKLPLILNLLAFLVFFLAAVAFKFTDVLPVTYRVVDCRDLVPVTDSTSETSWVEIDDAYFATSVVAFAVLLVSLG